MENTNFSSVGASGVCPKGTALQTFTGSVAAQIAQSLARQIAQREPSGWYVLRSAKGWMIGEMRSSAALDRHLIAEDGEPLVFATVEETLQFLREKCFIFSAAVYQR